LERVEIDSSEFVSIAKDQIRYFRVEAFTRESIFLEIIAWETEAMEPWTNTLADLGAGSKLVAGMNVNTLRLVLGQVLVLLAVAEMTFGRVVAVLRTVVCLYHCATLFLS
jgi:hypothetical protein